MFVRGSMHSVQAHDHLACDLVPGPPHPLLFSGKTISTAYSWNCCGNADFQLGILNAPVASRRLPAPGGQEQSNLNALARSG